MADPVMPPADDLVDVQTSWGVMPKWKARALALAEIQTVVAQATRNDALEREAAVAAHARKRAQYYRDLYDRCDRAEARCDALLAKEKIKQAAVALRREAEARAEAALLAAEAAYTAEPDPNDDE
jgi:hypothetical protein